MVTTVAVLGVGLVVAALLVVLAGSRHTAVDTIDPAPVEHWLVLWASRHPRIGRVLAHADRRVVGGAAVAVGFAVVFLAALSVGAIFDAIDTRSGFAQWDRSVAEWAGENVTGTSVTVLNVVTGFGASVYVLAALIVIGVTVAVRRRELTVLYFLLTVGLGIVAVNDGLKLIIMRERPQIDQLTGSVGSSFPSGHSATAAACWAAVALVMSRCVSRRFHLPLAAVAVGLAGAVAASRALLGVHWLTDVIAGVIVGWTWFFLVAIGFGGRLQGPDQQVEHNRVEHDTVVSSDSGSSPGMTGGAPGGGLGRFSSADRNKFVTFDRLSTCL